MSETVSMVELHSREETPECSVRLGFLLGCCAEIYRRMQQAMHRVSITDIRYRMTFGYNTPR